MAQRFPRLFIVLLAIVFALNLVQASITELIYDEAYYWYYAQELAWGYFDHPPMVAFLIAMGSWFFQGELGVRFMSTLLSVGTYVLLWLLVDNPRKREYVLHFFLLVFSFTLLNAYGFLTLPDTPLLFFTALFLWLYKRFLQRPALGTSLLLGVVMACLMYSKYHAVLVILFVILSNLRLLRDKKAWLAVIVALICYLPHLIWLQQNDFAPLNFHLSERPNQAYSFEKFTLGYFLNLVAIIGLLFYWVYASLFKFRAKDLFSKALLYLVYGVILFFFISSFSRRVQAQWAIVISIPLIVIAFGHLLENAKARKWMYRAGWISLILMIYARAWLVHYPLFPMIYETHGNKAWANALHTEAGDVPVVFENSYRLAPKYEFYSGVPAMSLNNYMYRKNQYSIDGSEEKFRGKRVAYVTSYRESGDFSYTNLGGTVHYGVFIDNFQSYRRLECLVEKPETGILHRLKVYNPYPFEIALGDLKYTISYSNAYKQVKETLPLKLTMAPGQSQFLQPRDTAYYTFDLPLPSQVGKSVYFRIGISEHGLPPGLNGTPLKIHE